MINNKKGFTLVEVIMVIVIVGTLAGVSSMYIKQIIDLWSFLTFRSEVVAQGRLGLMRMTRDIRQVRDKSAITTANVSQLQFTDINSNSINYQLSGSVLQRNSNNLINGASNFQFCYYDDTNVSLCSPECNCNVSSGNLNNIYRIKIKFDLTSGNQTKHLESQVFPRNLG